MSLCLCLSACVSWWSCDWVLELSDLGLQFLTRVSSFFDRGVELIDQGLEGFDYSLEFCKSLWRDRADHREVHCDN